jgi:lipopolysaccharide biosynthesis protein
MPGWDNTARRPNLANVFINATPEIYEIWLRETVTRVVDCRPSEERLVFINAWNEWAEGAHLEPDRRYGRQFLLATRRALTGAPTGGKPYASYRESQVGLQLPV